MKCPRCQHENPAGVKFCGACGTRLEVLCPTCQAANPPTNRFCHECGQVLTVAVEPVQAAEPTRPLGGPQAGLRIPAEAERRQLTVMFCDLVGSTALSGTLDPEDMREIVRAYQEACAEVIHSFEGHIAQYLGDGLLVYFGYPRAHEDDAPRAVRAALGIADAMERLNVRLRREGDARLAVRVGIHTGLVVVGEIGSGTRHEQLALGETPNLAARLQTIAEPDTVVISTATRRLIQGLFVLRDLGRHALKGVSAPMALFQVLGKSEGLSRLDAAARAGLTPLVGRAQEVGLLLDRWEQVTEGQGQVVLLSGEPGIGKSRLVQVVEDRVAGTPHRRLECRCSPYYQHTPLYPLIDLMPRVLEWRRDDTPQGKLRKLETDLAQYPVSRADVVPLLASLLSLPRSELYPLPAMSPERQRQKTLEAVVAVLVAIAAGAPVLLIVEDLQWSDPTTLDLLTLMLDQVPMARILTLLTSRPSFVPPWTPRSHLTPLTLTRFTYKQTELMVGRVAGGKVLPAEVLQQVVTKTDGVPLFVEELTKMVLESGLLREHDDHYALTGPLPPLAIPATLQDSLVARLDRVATVKEVAQLGATLGRAFLYELLRAVSPLDEATLQRELGRLVEAELLYQRGVPPQATYTFKHALIQEAAYQSLLKSTRQRYHQRIAQVLVEQFSDAAETRPEYVAHHYTEAGLSQQAVDYWQRAGQRAAQRSAYAETIAHLSRALELLKTLPDTAERARQELGVQTALGPALIASRGFAAAEVERACARARELCQQVGETPQLFPIVWALWAFYLVRADLRTADELAEQLLRLARSVQDPALLVPTHRALGTHFHFQGEFVRAQEHQTQGIALYDPQQDRSWAYHVEQHPGVVCRCFAAHHLWYLGYPDQALKSIQDALALALQLAHPYSVMHALDFAAWLHLYRREGQLTQERAESDIAYATEQQMAFFLTHATIFRGWALVEQGHGEEGLSQIRQGISAYRATGAEIEIPYWLGLLAEACGKLGRGAEGLPLIAEAIAEVRNKGWRFCEAELYRHKGELLLTLATENRGEAEACFHQALVTSHRQHAKSLELRAATSLSRLWLRQGKRDEARRVLAEVYGWFTEGFDTRDLQEARALLDELS